MEISQFLFHLNSDLKNLLDLYEKGKVIYEKIY